MEATNRYIPTKRTNRNSKPFWNEELSKASNELGALRRKFKYNSNFRNGQHLAQASDHFKKLLSGSASTWMSKILAEMDINTENSSGQFIIGFSKENLRDGPY